MKDQVRQPRESGKILVLYGALLVSYTWNEKVISSTPVFLNRRAVARYRALASIIPDREKPEETTVCYKISLVQLITNINVILYLSTHHTVYTNVLILYVVCFLLGNYPGSGFYMPTFRNTLSVPSS